MNIKFLFSKKIICGVGGAATKILFAYTLLSLEEELGSVAKTCFECCLL